MRANAKKSGTPTESISRGPSSIRPRTKGADRTQPTEYSEDEVNEEWEDYNQLTEDEKHVQFKAVMKKRVMWCTLTIQHTYVTKGELLEVLKPITHYCRVGREDHKEPKNGWPIHHLHAMVQLNKQMEVGVGGIY